MRNENTWLLKHIDDKMTPGYRKFISENPGPTSHIQWAGEQDSKVQDALRALWDNMGKETGVWWELPVEIIPVKKPKSRKTRTPRKKK